MKTSERIDLVLDARYASASALLSTFNSKHDLVSEREICDAWLEEIGKSSTLNCDGWYQPPPKGACVLIGNSKDNFDRLNYKSLRDPATWSSNYFVRTNESLIYAYASPFVRGTGMIGDFGITLYSGKDTRIRQHLMNCLDATIQIANYSEVGMPFKDLFRYAQNKMASFQLSNEASSIGSGLGNIGHTVPWSYGDCEPEITECLTIGSDVEVRKLISNARVSINELANLKIQPTMAFTIEPQIHALNMPLCSFHLIVTISNGKKTVIPSFNDLFECFLMNSYMRSVLEKLN